MNEPVAAAYQLGSGMVVGEIPAPVWSFRIRHETPGPIQIR